MIPGAGLLLAWILLGAAVVRLLRLGLSRTEGAAAASVCGILLGSSLTLAAVCFGGYSIGIPASGIAAVLIAAAVGIRVGTSRAQPDRPDDKPRAGIIGGVLLLAVTLLLGTLFWTHFLWQRGGDYYSGGGTWGDLALHLSLVSRFAHQERFTSDLPIFAGAKLSYPFLVDFASAALVRAGWSLRAALMVPGLILALASVLLLYGLAARMLRTAAGAILSCAIFLLNGGAGGLVHAWRDWRSSGTTVTSFLLHLPRDYANLPEANLHFANLISSYLLPQRSILLGLPAFLLIALLFRGAWHAPAGARRRPLAGAAILLAFLPLAHVHTWLVGVASWAWLAAVVTLRERRLGNAWLVSLGCSLLIAAPPMAWLLTGTVDRDFSHWYLGWMRAPQSSVVGFWLRNMGLGVPLMLAGLVLLWRGRRRDAFALHLYAPLVVIFVATNLYIFQPHAFDNMKFMVYSYAGLAVLAGGVLAQALRRGAAPRIAALLVFASLTAVGGLSVIHESQVAWKFLGREEIAVAERFRSAVPPEARVLTSDAHNHFVPTLTGRRIVMGYRGWLWTYGLDYRERERDVATMFAGGLDASRLLGAYRIDFVVIGPTERSGFRASEDFYRARYPAALRSESYAVYDVRARAGPGDPGAGALPPARE